MHAGAHNALDPEMSGMSIPLIGTQQLHSWDDAFVAIAQHRETAQHRTSQMGLVRQNSYYASALANDTRRCLGGGLTFGSERAAGHLSDGTDTHTRCSFSLWTTDSVRQQETVSR